MNTQIYLDMNVLMITTYQWMTWATTQKKTDVSKIIDNFINAFSIA